MGDTTLYRLFEDAAHSAWCEPALELPGETIPYSRLHEHISNLVQHLCETLTRPGPIAVLAESGPQLLQGFFACAAIGRPALLLDPAMPQQVIARLLTQYPAAALLTTPKTSQTAVRSGPPIIRLGERLPSSRLAELPAVKSCAEFYWGLTSGTTGDAKLFARSHASWTASFAAAETVFCFPPRSRVLIPGPLHHSLFLYGAVHALCRGLTVLLPGAFRPSRIAPYLRATTHLYAVPFMLGELVKFGSNAPNLGAVFSGGAKLTADQRQRCEQAWPAADLVEFYGASETSFLTFHSTRAPTADGSVGRPFPGVQIEIRDPAGLPLPPGHEGEIFSSGSMLFSRYVGEAPVNGMFSVGDTGFIDRQGCLHLTGRVNRIINSKALKIRPEIIEAALMELPEVRRAAVVDIPEAARGAVPVAAIETTKGDIRRNVLSAHCRRKLGPRLCPRRYYIADALPLTASGKVAVAQIRASLLAQDPAFRELR
jgi:long-chain acyl-CoA synthetase